jgi:hypothetical protein
MTRMRSVIVDLFSSSGRSTRRYERTLCTYVLDDGGYCYNNSNYLEVDGNSMRAESLSLEAGMTGKGSVSEFQPNTQTKRVTTPSTFSNVAGSLERWSRRRPHTAKTRKDARRSQCHDMILHQNATYKVPNPIPPKSHVIP